MPRNANQPNNGANAAQQLAELLESHGWVVSTESRLADAVADLLADKGPYHYVIEVKRIGEGRADRVLASLSKAILVAQHHAKKRYRRACAVVIVDQASRALVQKIDEFQRQYAPDVAVGLVADSGLRFFSGPGLDSLNEEAHSYLTSEKKQKPNKASDLFTDLNQWMLKVLLAPEIPEPLLRAPRAQYRSVSDLAQAARVSMMSASRFVARLREEGLLESVRGAFHLVRRTELFRLWQSAALKSTPELPMRFLMPGGVDRSLHSAASRAGSCLALFAASDLLKIGHVSGVTPYLYVRQLKSVSSGNWPNLVTPELGERPQVILKQPLSPESVFRGAVDVHGVHVCDALQIWLDASAHPSRGNEQAEFLRRTVLSKVFEASP